MAEEFPCELDLRRGKPTHLQMTRGWPPWPLPAPCYCGHERENSRYERLVISGAELEVESDLPGKRYEASRSACR